MFLAKPLRFRADLVCARSLRGKAPFFGAALFCAQLTLRVEPASEPRRAIPLANPGERSHLANCPCEPQRAILPCDPACEPQRAIPPSVPSVYRPALSAHLHAQDVALLPCARRDRMLAKYAPSVWQWQGFAVVRAQTAILGSFSLHAFSKGPRTGKAPLPGNLSQLRVFGLPAMARFRRCVFPDARRWQNAREMRFQAFDSGKISLRCVPEGASDEKNASSWQDIAAMHSK